MALEDPQVIGQEVITEQVIEEQIIAVPAQVALKSDSIPVGGKLRSFWNKWESPTVQTLFRWGLT